MHIITRKSSSQNGANVIFRQTHVIIIGSFPIEHTHTHTRARETETECLSYHHHDITTVSSIISGPVGATSRMIMIIITVRSRRDLSVVEKFSAAAGGDYGKIAVYRASTNNNDVGKRHTAVITRVRRVYFI